MRKVLASLGTPTGESATLDIVTRAKRNASVAWRWFLLAPGHAVIAIPRLPPAKQFSIHELRI